MRLKTLQTTHCTEVRFASFLSGGLITAIVVNPPESKLVKRISVHCTVLTGQISLSLGMFVYADEPPLAIYLPIPKYSTYQNVGPYFLKSQVSFRPQFNDSKAKIDDGISSSSPPCFS
jgi:hypothetical protein